MKVLTRICPGASHRHLFHPFIDSISSDASGNAIERFQAERSINHTFLKLSETLVTEDTIKTHFSLEILFKVPSQSQVSFDLTSGDS